MTKRNDFFWDERSDQPGRIGGRISNFLTGMKDICPMFLMLCRNVADMPFIAAKYLSRRNKAVTREIPLNAIGCSVSFNAANEERLADAFRETKAGTLFVRVLSWQKDGYENTAQFIKGFNKDRTDVVISFVQDRASVCDLSLWEDRLESALNIFSPLSAYFQIGHVPNRKKWGFHSTREYEAVMRKSSERKPSDVHYIGPSCIDFEILYTDAILHRLKEIPFDVYNSLLYVDRRGNPENAQWPGFDLPGKIHMTRAVGDCCGLENAPLWITEVNWPLKDKHGYAPAARNVCVTEKEYADYLSRYYLLAYATGIPDRIIWWQLAAYGYGLVDDYEGAFRKRPGFEAFKTVARLLPGRRNTHMSVADGLYCAGFSGMGTTLYALWRTKGEQALPLKMRPLAVYTSTNVEFQLRNGTLPVSSGPVFALFEGDVPFEEAF